MVYMFVWHGVEEDIRSDNEDDGNGSTNGHMKKAVGNGKIAANGKKDA